MKKSSSGGTLFQLLEISSNDSRSREREKGQLSEPVDVRGIFDNCSSISSAGVI
jgi:hypothetical protein